MPALDAPAPKTTPRASRSRAPSPNGAPRNRVMDTRRTRRWSGLLCARPINPGIAVELTARTAVTCVMLRGLTCELGDARDLSGVTAGADAVLLLGPLYHLTEASDRASALADARRIVRPGGVVVAVGISRFASLMDGLKRRNLDDPVFRPIVPTRS